MKQQVREYFDRTIEEAFSALLNLKPGESVCFVGKHELAKDMMEKAAEMGFIIKAPISEGFGLHVLTLVEIKEKKEQKIEASSFSGRVRNLLAIVLSPSHGRSIA